MVGLSENQHNMASDFKLKLKHCAGCAVQDAQNLLMSLQNRQLIYEDAFVPKYNASLLILRFKSQADKDKVLNYPDYKDLIARKEFSEHVPTVNTTNRESDRTVFVWRLNPLMFQMGVYRDNYEESKTEFKAILTDRLAEDGMPPQDIQFLYTPENTPPKQMRIKFPTPEMAKKFLSADTRKLYIHLPQRFKKIDVHIPIPQCRRCKKKTHQVADCTESTSRCPRCLSILHLEPIDSDPTACPPTCWTHKAGHSTGSAKCPDNIKFRQMKRKENRISEERTNLLNNVEPGQRLITGKVFDLHQKVKTIKTNNTTPGVSYANTVLGQAMPYKLTPDFSPKGYASCYTGAMLQAIYNPDPLGFQEIMNAYEKANGWPVCKHPPLSPHFINALSDQEPLLPKNLGNLLAGRLPRMENTPASESRRRPRAHSTSPQTANSSPLTKTRRTESISEDDYSDSGSSPAPAQPSPAPEVKAYLKVMRAQELEPSPLPSGHPSPTEEHAHDSSNSLAAATSEVMEVTPLSAPPTKSPEQIQKSAKPKDKSKGKTSPRSMVNIKTIRAELEKTRASPIGITIQHDASQPSHPAPRKLLKDLCWRISTSADSFPRITIAELHDHIKFNRILYTPPVNARLTLNTIETLAQVHPVEEVFFTVEPKDRTVTSTTGKVTNLPGSRAASPVRPHR